ncbi:hypothetical protein U14_04287 [Candidatus Moduliflexus flocculans]|uniref:Uncharacterized protein n=1 Tax=Candidatus Moduliflexus flocculans TaxID=1499966 RepID=A0A0S6W3U7_9BACT|nr:hypothetical protein U14_04287 [Candidatus Moduliflexus flocculans]
MRLLECRTPECNGGGMEEFARNDNTLLLGSPSRPHQTGEHSILSDMARFAILVNCVPPTSVSDDRLLDLLVTDVTQRRRQFPSWEGQGVGSSVSDCSCQEPTPNPSPEGSVRSFVSNRLRNMS